VLEFNTATNPVPVALSQEQLDRLATVAAKQEPEASSFLSLHLTSRAA
jgi:hypothetical protein